MRSVIRVKNWSDIEVGSSLDDTVRMRFLQRAQTQIQMNLSVSDGGSLPPTPKSGTALAFPPSADVIIGER